MAARLTGSSRRRWCASGAALALWAAAWLLPPSATQAGDTRALSAPGQGAVRALLVGIDQYQHVNALKGAVADARDLQASLARMGSGDVTALIDREADRIGVLAALQALLDRTQRGDLVVLALAGHGAKEPERVKGSSPDGTDEVFLLAGFDPKTGPGGAEKILNHEFKHFIKALEDRGARVIFIADTCFGGGLVREVTPGASGLVYRQVPRYRLVEDDLKPVSTPAEALLNEAAFDRTTFLAAADRDTKAPEVTIAGQARGALSFAMARAFEGSADEHHDGRITAKELFSYVRKVVYQLSDERQNVVAIAPLREDLDRAVVFEVAGPIPLRPPVAQPDAPIAAAAPPAVPALRLASTTGRTSAFQGIVPLLTPFEIVAPDADPDLVWDPVAKEASADGDKIALDVGAADLPGVVDRTAALRDIKRLVVAAPQAIHVSPDASLHRAGSRVDIEVSEAAGRSLIMIDLTGSGTVQMLYPLQDDPPVLAAGSYRLAVQVRDPFGADEIIAVTANAALPKLQAALLALDGRRSAGQLAVTLARYMPPDARLGVVGVFTIP